MINKISFKGVQIVGNMQPEKVRDIAKFVSDNKKTIKTLEKKYQTDVFINSENDTATLVHSKYHDDINRFGKTKDIPFKDFNEDIIDEVEIALIEEENEFARMNDIALLDIARRAY